MFYINPDTSLFTVYNLLISIAAYPTIKVYLSARYELNVSGAKLILAIRLNKD